MNKIFTAEDLLDGWRRICNLHADCERCKLKSCGCKMLPPNHNFIPTIKEWTKNNPLKTYKDVLEEKFPNIMFNPDYYCVKRMFGDNPMSCPITVDYSATGSILASAPCEECWNQLAPEEYQDEL